MNSNNKFNQNRTQKSTSYEPIGKPKNEFKVIILNDQNYYGWSKYMENNLMSQKLLKHIQYTDPRDYYFENKGDDEDIDDPSEIKLTAKQKQRWNEDEERTIALLRNSLNQRYQLQVQDKKSACVIWETLKTTAQKNNTGSRIALSMSFFRATINDNEKPTEFIDRLSSLVDKCRVAELELDEELVCYKILASLPDKYETVIQNCAFIPPDELSIIELRDKLSTIEETKALHQRPHIDKKANINQVNTNNTRGKKCFLCGGENHLAKECRAPDWKKDKFRKEKELMKERHSLSSDNQTTNPTSTTNVPPTSQTNVTPTKKERNGEAHHANAHVMRVMGPRRRV